MSVSSAKKIGTPSPPLFTVFNFIPFSNELSNTMSIHGAIHQVPTQNFPKK